MTLEMVAKSYSETTIMARCPLPHMHKISWEIRSVPCSTTPASFKATGLELVKRRADKTHVSKISS